MYQILIVCVLINASNGYVAWCVCGGGGGGGVVCVCVCGGGGGGGVVGGYDDYSQK